MGPAVAFPVRDGLLVALDRPPLRNLARPAVTPQQAPDVIGVIVHAEFPFDHPGNSGQRPQFVGVTVGHRPFQQQFQQAAAFGLAQFPGSPRHRFASQRLQSTLRYRLTPAGDRRDRGPDPMADFFHRQAAFQQFDGSPPSPLQRLRRAMWSHVSYIGVLLPLLLRNAIGPVRSESLALRREILAAYPGVPRLSAEADKTLHPRLLSYRPIRGEESQPRHNPIAGCSRRI